MHSDTELLKLLPGFSEHYEEVNQTKLHYVIGGQGDPLVLLPGYPETWWAYHKVLPALASRYSVIVVEIRGMGASDKPIDGYEKKNMARDVRELVTRLGYNNINICGHDIGAHVAFSYATNYPESTARLILLDTPHPDPGMYHLPMLPVPGGNYVYPWWLAFNQVKEIPELLLEGKMDVLIEWMFQNLLVDLENVSQFDKGVYTLAYNSKDAIRASNAWYQAFPQDIEDYKTYSPLTIPVLGIGGSGYEILAMSLPQAASDLKLMKIEDCGHFMLEEKPDEVVKMILEFLSR
ncbi:MAG: alpha/beta hydrolase [Sphingobacterium sp.]|nr:alpha/beta hydrolase [Sphingobacterium sp.]